MSEVEAMPFETTDILFWDPLLELIDEGRVIPVVGSDLLVGSSGSNLYRDMGVRLAARLGQQDLALPQGHELNEAACRHLARGGNLREIYPALKIVAGQILKDYPIPEVLLQLARIKPLKLFVTTTFDPLLTRALNQERAGGRPETQTIAYAPNDAKDLPREWKLHQVPAFVYQLLGTLSAEPSYVVTEEDVIEFFHALQSETRRPPILFDELKKQSLLVLGVRFNSWVARFFMRMSKGEPLSVHGTPNYLADSASTTDDLVVFLRTFSRGTKVYTGGGGVEFVRELYERWSARVPAGAEAEALSATSKQPGAVFLSYASEDRDVVEKIKNRLEAEGMDVFFDKDQLEGGDEWDKKLRRNIRHCSLFLPVISRNTLTREKRYFRIEWNDAIEIERMTPPGEAFLFPIVIDTTSPTEGNLPARFHELQSVSAPGGELSPELIARIKQLYRKHQLAVSAGTV
jgi:hypothetical protein